MTILLASSVDAAVVLALALAATAVLRRRSAALRHAILATAIVTALVMPAFELLLPQLHVVRWHAPVTVVSSGVALTPGDATSGAATPETGAAAGEGVRWAVVLVLAWMAGTMATCAGFVTGLVRLARLRARCTPVTGRWRELTDALSGQCGVRRHVTLLQSDAPSLLVTCGVLKPGIILPAGASGWTDDRRRVVLLHELAHVGRHDAVIQIAAAALRALHWFNPLVWVACRRLRQESEYACDDAVLRRGIEAAEYATHLLDVARHLSGRHGAWASAPAIAHPSTLERRIVAMLHGTGNRAPVSRRGWAVTALVALGIGMPLAAAGVAPAEPEVVVPPEAREGAARPPAVVPEAEERAEQAAPAQTPATIAGRVLDESGGIIPGAQVTLINAQTREEVVQHTDVSGRFAFRDLRPARYELATDLAGFASVSSILTLAPGAALQRTITLPLGTVQETITVVCSATPAARGALSGAARLQQFVARAIRDSVFPVLSAQEPIRVGGSVRLPKKLTNVNPVCPPTTPASDTTVRLTGRLDLDGFMNDVTPVPAEPGAEPPMELTTSALEAVRQWTFTPALLNGEPVEVSITVHVVFQRSTAEDVISP